MAAYAMQFSREISRDQSRQADDASRECRGQDPRDGGRGGEERSSSYVKCCNPAIRLRSDKASGANGFISFRDKLSGSFAARGPRQTYARPR
jgi:hypothetical protein